MRLATGITLQPQQILRLPRKMNFMIDAHHRCNVIYNALSNRHHPPTSANTAPASQNESHDWSASHMKRHLQCTEQQAAPSNLTKYCACHARWISWCMRITDATSFTMRLEHASPSNLSKYCACHAKGMTVLYLLTYEMSLTMRGATGINLQPHQILRLPRKMNLMIDPHHRCNVIYNARSIAEQQASPSNLTKYCACHAKWISWLMRITDATSLTMRLATGITLQPQQILRLPRKMNLMIDPHHRCNVIYNALRYRHHTPTSPNTAPATQNESHDWSASHMKRHLQCAEHRGATGITLQPHQILRLPRKRNVMIDPHHIWNVIYKARSNRHQPPTSPNTAPTTKWISWLIRITYETSFTMRGATGINLQPHQILRLPRKRNDSIVPAHIWNVIYNMGATGISLQPHQILRLPRRRSVMIDLHHIWNVIYNARSNRHHPPTSANTAPATQNCTPKS